MDNKSYIFGAIVGVVTYWSIDLLEKRAYERGRKDGKKEYETLHNAVLEAMEAGINIKHKDKKKGFFK